jgi:hypothetical protein
MPSLAAAAGQDLTAVGGLHAFTETMHRLPAAAMGLECTFHDFITFSLSGMGTGRTVQFFARSPGHHTRGIVKGGQRYGK